VIKAFLSNALKQVSDSPPYSNRPESLRFDWLGAAVDLARDVYPQLVPESISEVLDQLASPLVGTDVSRLPAWRQAEEVSKLMYEVHGFRGNEVEYDDPRNSLINDVLSRRVGIPISLALVYSEIARRLGVATAGVGFPGHFLVKVVDRVRTAGVDRSVFIDPFSEGVTLDDDGLALIAERVTGSAEVDPSWLEPVALQSIVSRTLNNLRGAYNKRGDYPRLLVVLQRLCDLEPKSPGYLRDRGLVQARLGAPRAAISDLEQYLDWAPQASDVQQIQSLIIDLRGKLHRGRAIDQLN
jgi:regulator of sirC expression with transglutaminase-like and TPR domain